jgi:hypothetical protein
MVGRAHTALRVPAALTFSGGNLRGIFVPRIEAGRIRSLVRARVADVP